MKGRILSIALWCVFALFLTACQKKEAAWQPGMPIAAKDIKIGVLYLTDPDKETSGFTYEHHAGIRAMQKTLGLADEQIVIRRNVSDTDTSEVEYVLREFAAAGVHIVFTASVGYAEACAKVAADRPNMIFATVASHAHNDTNLTNYYGAIHQARYLSGIVAGLRTQTNKIGYVAALGVEDSQVTSGLNAFAMGVESVNPAAKVYVYVTYNWFDSAGEALATRVLIERGSDVISHHTDTSTPMLEAQKAGVWGIGYNSDMSREAPDAVLTSVVWHWGAYYTALVRSVLDGSFTTTPSFMGIKEGVVGLSPLNEKLIVPGTEEALAKAAARIESGSGVFDGVMETNDGRQMGQAGNKLSPQDIMRNITWYYRNVIVIPSVAPSAAQSLIPPLSH